VRVHIVAHGEAATGLDVPEKDAHEAFDKYATPWAIKAEAALRGARDKLSTERLTGGRKPA
jgi:hypothetical protein